MKKHYSLVFSSDEDEEGGGGSAGGDIMAGLLKQIRTAKRGGQGKEEALHVSRTKTVSRKSGESAPLKKKSSRSDVKKVKKTQTRYTFVARYTVRKEMKCSGASEILHGLVHDTTRISSFFSDFRVVS